MNPRMELEFGKGLRQAMLGCSPNFDYVSIEEVPTMNHSRLNPLVADRIAKGENPHTVDPTKGTGKTTADALLTLGRAMHYPGVETPPSVVNESMEVSRICQTALTLAEGLGMSHIYGVPSRQPVTMSVNERPKYEAIIFEYRPGNEARTPLQDSEY